MSQHELEMYQAIFEHLYFGGDKSLYHKLHKVEEVKIIQGANTIITAVDIEDLLKEVTDRGVCTVWATFDPSINGEDHEDRQWFILMSSEVENIYHQLYA
jgi:hypothetical protein